MRIALLANPQSGDGEAGAVAQLLAAQGADVDAYGLDDCEAAIESQPERIVVAGGDGSVACAAEAAARAGVPLALVAVGTANDFARALDLPREPERAAELAATGSRTRRLDLGRIEGAQARPFVNAVSTGLSPLAARKADGLKRRLGPLAYAVAALRAGLSAHPVSCEVLCDGSSLFAGKAWQVTVGLTGAFGGGAEVEADPADGLLDVVVVRAGSRVRLVAYAYGMRAGEIERHSGVITGECRQVELRTDGSTGFNVDGEIVEAQKLRLEVERSAFQLVVG